MSRNRKVHFEAVICRAGATEWEQVSREVMVDREDEVTSEKAVEVLGLLPGDMIQGVRAWWEMEDVKAVPYALWDSYKVEERNYE